MSTPDFTCKVCSRRVYQYGSRPASDKCIFHSTEKDAAAFVNELIKQFNYWKQHRSTIWDFSGWIFPMDSQEALQKHLPSIGNGLLEYLMEMDFTDTEFISGINFESVLFPKVNFIGSIFHETPNFKNAHFHANADFSRAKFIKGVMFDNATFWSEGIFEETRFHGKIGMSHTSFAGVGKFDSSVICGIVRLEWPGLGGKLLSDGKECKRGQVLLKSLKFEKINDELPALDYRSNYLQSDCELIIQDLKMYDVLLVDTDCRKIKFEHVKWPQRWHRLMVADEYLARKRKGEYRDSLDWNKITNTYQQLTGYYREKLNHTVANDFESGIFSARLKAANQGKNRDNKLLLRAYWLASYFGCNTWQPVWLVFGLLVIFAWLYGAVLYGYFFIWSSNCDYDTVWDCLVTSMRVVSLDRSWFSREVDLANIGSFKRLIISALAILQTVLTATLVTLFVFAVRRRFKHSE